MTPSATLPSDNEGEVLLTWTPLLAQGCLNLGETVRDVEPLVNACRPGSLPFGGTWQIPCRPATAYLANGSR